MLGKGSYYLLNEKKESYAPSTRREIASDARIIDGSLHSTDHTAYKIFSKILSERLRHKIEAILGWYQTGFRKGKGTTDQMHTLRQILERMKEENITAFYLFADFKSAFDSVIREQLYATMLEMCVPMKLVKLTTAALKSVRSRVKIQGIKSETFEAKRFETRRLFVILSF
jgi:sorting nexin-29